jgi:hypothetical protein
MRNFREMLVFQFESEVLRVERHGASDILHLIANAVKARDERLSLCASRFGCLSRLSLLFFFPSSLVA